MDTSSRDDTREYNRLAVASGLLGLAFLFGIGSVLALVWGLIARRQIAERPDQKGAGLALAGIIMGSAWIAALLLILVWLERTG